MAQTPDILALRRDGFLSWLRLSRCYIVAVAVIIKILSVGTRQRAICRYQGW